MENRAVMRQARIQVVENERIIGEELAFQIKELGHTVSSLVSSGEEAVNRARTDRPDIVIMDIKLDGEMDGIKAARIIHENFEIPIIYLTAYIDNQTVQRASRTVSYGYIIKPFTTAILKVTIEMALARIEMERRFSHMHRVLKTIKNVSQIINHEPNLEKLIQDICSKLRSDRSFDHAWIIILDEHTGALSCGFAGYGEDPMWAEEFLRNPDNPECKNLAMQHAAIILNDNYRCEKCRFFMYENKSKACTLRISYENTVYGAIHLSIPENIPLDDEEISLMQELAADIGFAVYAITQEQERKKIAEKEKLQANQLIQASKMASLGILVSGIAHEINNPNNFIMLNTPVLQDIFNTFMPLIDKYANLDQDGLVAGLEYGELKKQIELLFSGILTGSERIKRIVDELKTFSRTEELEKYDSVNLVDVINSAVVLLSNLVKKATNRFSTVFDELPVIKGNYQKLEQVFINLIQNACQALENSNQAVTITCRYNGEEGSIQVQIRDEGRGIPEGNMDKIFEPFFTTKRSIGGTGLGLPISLQIIKQHGGDIRFISHPGDGTTAEVTLPVKNRTVHEEVV